MLHRPCCPLCSMFANNGLLDDAIGQPCLLSCRYHCPRLALFSDTSWQQQQVREARCSAVCSRGRTPRCRNDDSDIDKPDIHIAHSDYAAWKKLGELYKAQKDKACPFYRAAASLADSPVVPTARSSRPVQGPRPLQAVQHVLQEQLA